jgi:hypothetical protein
VTLGNMRDLGVQRLIFLSQPGLPSHCTDRSLERTLKSHTSKAESSAPSAQPKEQDRREAELERANAAGEPHWQGLAMRRMLRRCRRRQPIFCDGSMARGTIWPTVSMRSQTRLRARPSDQCIVIGISR